MSKNILITGASRGIGKAIASLFAKEGYHVYMCCKSHSSDLEQLAIALSAKHSVLCQAFCCDVSDYSQVEAMFQTLPPMDIVVNNAGISCLQLLTDTSPEEWNQVIGTNLSSVFYTSRLAVPPMLCKGGGHIINISSVWGTVGASMEVAYSASKGGVNAFTKALAKELAPSHIQVNAIACGYIDTEMNSHLSAEEAAAIFEEIPAGRAGTPEEVAKLALMLASSPTYFTGQILTLDGGWT